MIPLDFWSSVWTGMKRGAARVLPIPAPEPLDVSVEAQIDRPEDRLNRAVVNAEIRLDQWERDIGRLEAARRAYRDRRAGDARP